MIRKVLVTGGAGYIGSHMTRLLVERNYEVKVFDNLSTGHSESLPSSVEFIQGDLKDLDAVERLFSKRDIDAVMHFAAHSLVGESMENPLKYYTNNLIGGLNLLNAMKKYDVDIFVFSSTAAVYGEPETVPITEDFPLMPTNHYGKSKLMFENILDSCIKYGIKSACLRYFNAAGAGFGIGEDHNPETHLIPITLKVALGKIEKINIFGDDYDTSDGTCIRDYVHVLDLAEAHILALRKLEKAEEGCSFKYNLGSEKGYSVKEVVNTARDVTGHAIPANISKRRPGDPAKLVASFEKAKKELGWEPKFNLADIISSAWEWHKNNPNGFC